MLYYCIKISELNLLVAIVFYQHYTNNDCLQPCQQLIIILQTTKHGKNRKANYFSKASLNLTSFLLGLCPSGSCSSEYSCDT